MAVTSIWRIKGIINKVILYATNPQKTEEIENKSGELTPENILNVVLDYTERESATEIKKYVSGVNCGVKDSVNEMMNVKKHFGKTGGTVAYHGYQSFTKDEVDADTAHKIGCELANKLWGDRYQVVVATHIDKESHIHNHFILNTVSFVDGKKYHRTNKDYLKIKEKTQPQPKVTNAEKSVDTSKAPKQRKQTPPKTRGKANVKKANTDKGVRKPNSANSKIKQTKRSAENTGKTIKTAKDSVKNTGKTVKTAKSTSKATAETAKRTKQAAQATAKATVKTVKVVGKALVEAGKVVVAGAKSIGAAIAAGGVPAIVVVIVICLIGAIGGTCFGIFLANDETTGTDKTMSQAISELTSEHYANLLALRTSYTYDLYEVQGNTSINWKEVLAVYAVKITSNENPLEVVTLNEEKMDLLREIMQDMNTMTGAIVPRVVGETTVTTDEEGHSVKMTTYVTKRVLVVTIAQLNANQIVEVYNLNDEAKAQIKELLSPEYDALWSDLIGSNGMIINPNTSYVGTGIFAWPLDGDYTITSPFGTRVDPISGVVKTHGGTDIAAPTGTPLLAAADGTVVTASYDDGGYGFYVKIKHNETYTTLYGHCSVLLVTVGQTVKQGQVIAEVGSTGYSTGPHVHYEVIQNGVRVDAMWFYKQ